MMSEADGEGRDADARHVECNNVTNGLMSTTSAPVDIVEVIPHGDPGLRAQVSFSIVAARIAEQDGKKYVSYSIRITDQRTSNVDVQRSSAVTINRRYSDFCFIYECILRHSHPSVLGDFVFPKKVLMGNFNADTIEERTKAFQQFLVIIANDRRLLFSSYFFTFLSSTEQNEAISLIKLDKLSDALSQMETVYLINEKLVSIATVQIYLCLCELVALAAAVKCTAKAYSYARLAEKSFQHLLDQHPAWAEQLGHRIPLAPSMNQAASPSPPSADSMSHAVSEAAKSYRIPFLQLASQLTKSIATNWSACGGDQVAKGSYMDPSTATFDRQLAEIKYSSGKVFIASTTLMDAVTERYIHRTSHSISSS